MSLNPHIPDTRLKIYKHLIS